MASMKIGECYFVRTVTDYWIGRVTDIHPFGVTLEDASWIASTGRLSTFMKTGKAENMEVEPVGEVTCNWISWLPWPHKLFNKAI